MHPLRMQLRGHPLHNSKSQVMMTLTLKARCLDLLCELGLASEDDPAEVIPFGGGVASDIARVDVSGRSYCVKFALERLKVAEEWRVPAHRNRAEYAWLEFAARVDQSAVPCLYGQSGTGFAMEHIASPDALLWKDELLYGIPDIRRAIPVAEILAKIHSASADSAHCQNSFRNHDDFMAIRIEPYLHFTASRHPDLARQLNAIGEGLYRSRQVLVHGDVSPKNILFRGNCPVLLDAECATMGDPAFDVAFCLNHLALKSIHRPDHRDVLVDGATRFWLTYAAGITWEPPDVLEGRVAALLPALLLARVDGKSPVEYLSRNNQDRIRNLARPLIRNAPARLEEVLTVVRQAGCRGDE